VAGRSLRELRADALDRLARAGVDNPANDVAWLLADAVGVERKLLVTAAGLTVEQQAVFEASLRRRESREPLQHILGDTGFRYLTLRVGPGVFVPRPETEVLVEHALESIRMLRSHDPDRRITVVDLCSGSGAIAIAIATEVRDCDVFAVEVDRAAADWAAANIADYREQISTAGSTLALIRTAVQDAVSQNSPLLAHRRNVDVITCNPPYIPDAAIPRDREVREFDPAIALYGGPDGLDVVRQVAGVAADLLRSGGWLFVEHGDEQGERSGDLGVPALLRVQGDFEDVQDHRDLSDRPRVSAARRKLGIAVPGSLA